MAIQETTKRIHFSNFETVKGRTKNDYSDAPTLTVDRGKIRFNKSILTELNLNGKFVRFYVDPVKSIIGFQVREEVQLGEMKGNDRWKLVRVKQNQSQWAVQFTKTFSLILGEDSAKTRYGQLPVMKYVEQADAITKGEVYYYVKLEKPEEEIPMRKRGPYNKRGKLATEEDLEKALQELGA